MFDGHIESAAFTANSAADCTQHMPHAAKLQVNIKNHTVEISFAMHATRQVIG